MFNKTINGDEKKEYDLYERTSRFGEKIIDFVKILNENAVTRPIINQLIRSATSIGANYMEADCAESRKDFKHKVGICRKEAKETTHWLRMLARAVPEKADYCRVFWREARELTLIFSSIFLKR